MKVSVRMCDICRTDVDANWPLNLSTGHGIDGVIDEHLNVDFCSVDCLRSWVAALQPEQANSEEG